MELFIYQAFLLTQRCWQVGSAAPCGQESMVVVFQRTKGFLKMTSPVTPVLDEFMTDSAPGSYFNKFNIVVHTKSYT